MSNVHSWENGREQIDEMVDEHGSKGIGNDEGDR